MKYGYKVNKFRTFLHSAGAFLSMFIWGCMFMVLNGEKWPVIKSSLQNVSMPDGYKGAFLTLLFIGMVIIPFMDIIKRKRLLSTEIETSKKGLKIKCLDQEYKFVWTDMKNAGIIYDTTLKKQVYPRKLIFTKSNGEGKMPVILEIDNKPYDTEFPDIVGLVKEILQHEPKARQEVIGAEKYCPWHGHFERDACPECKARIKHGERWLKIFYTVNPAYVFVLPAIGLLGTAFAIFSLCFAIIAIGVPIILIFKTDRQFSRSAAKTSEKES